MKLSYECWRQRKKLSDIFIEAINKTLDENEALQISHVQKMLDSEDGVPVYSATPRDNNVEEIKEEIEQLETSQ